MKDMRSSHMEEYLMMMILKPYSERGILKLIVYW